VDHKTAGDSAPHKLELYVACRTDRVGAFFYLGMAGQSCVMVMRAWAGYSSSKTRSSAMRTLHPLIRLSGTAMLAIVSLSLAACSGMTQQEKNTAIGAGVGAIGGAILTGGSTAGTVGGAAVGGVIGHEVDKK
jgi:osmotically inducible lipoprotein OsmB